MEGQRDEFPHCRNPSTVCTQAEGRNGEGERMTFEEFDLGLNAVQDNLVVQSKVMEMNSNYRATTSNYRSCRGR